MNLRRMPRFIAIFILLFAAPLIYGQVDASRAAPQGDTAPNPSAVYLARLFSPENLPTVALFLVGIFGIIVANGTLHAIEEQSKISNAILATQFRPRVIVRSVKLDPSSCAIYDRRGDGSWKIEVLLTNVGGTLSHVQRCDVSFDLYAENGSPYETVGAQTLDEPFVLRPGDRHSLELKLPGDKFRTILHAMETAFANHTTKLVWPTCRGTIVYHDENGFERRTGFARQWEIETKHFKLIDDPENEYTD
ncbi:MAG: hypothetical protein ABSD67_25205 [Terracidiphilus sp.]